MSTKQELKETHRPDLVDHYRPIALKAVAAALCIPPGKQSHSRREIESYQWHPDFHGCSDEDG